MIKKTRLPYSLQIEQLDRHCISGVLLYQDTIYDLNVPFTGLVKYTSKQEYEFCFFIEWSHYMEVDRCYTTFVGKHSCENDAELIRLEWMLVGNQNEFLSFNGENRLTKLKIDVKKLYLSEEQQVLPIPLMTLK